MEEDPLMSSEPMKPRRGLTSVQTVLLLARVTMETGVVAVFCYWGVHQGGNNTAAKVALGILAPLVGFGIWGSLDFRFAGTKAEALRLAEELIISLLAATALYSTGRQSLALALGSLSIGYHILVYACGERLLKPAS
jgi:Protein of unknown function (DUF2568)